MTLGSLSFAAHNWLWPAVILFAAGASLILIAYRRARLSQSIRLLCVFLKLAGLALLLSFLLEPMWNTTRPREGANLFAILADNSMGLQLHDPGESKTRGELLSAELTHPKSVWQERLEETYATRRYLFDSRLQSTRDFSELNFEGHSTALEHALKSIHDRFAGQPLAGVLLFTDGNATDMEKGYENIPGLPPIYPVVVGKEGALRDLAIQRPSASQTVFEDSPVTITATARADGFAGERLKTEVLLNGKVIAQQVQPIRKNNEEIPLRFEIKTNQPGVSFYHLRVSLDGNVSSNRLEATELNNSSVVAVDRGKGPHRILYLSGRPNWEYKFLNRALSEDPEVQMAALIRIAKREPKFTFRGRMGESSNPLFRGFNKEDEETARYDQPVLIRLNTKDQVELRDGFPKTPEDLFAYEAVVISDLEAEFFTADQMLLIQKYVSERGGGLLMLGGADSLQDGKYARTPIGEMLPVYLDRLPPPELTGDFKLDLTREGWLQPWIRLRANEQDEKTRLEQLPGMHILNQLKEVKPGAVVLATATGRNGTKYPGIVMQRFGSGHVLSITFGDMWRGGLGDEQRQSDLQKEWRQIIRWLISDVPPRFALHVEPSSTDQEEAMQLTLIAKDTKFEPLENAIVRMKVTAPAPGGKTNEVALTAEPSDKNAGSYQASYLPRETGAYLATATVSDSSGMILGEAQAGWASEPLAKEFESLTPNTKLLQNIAAKTGGQLLYPADLASFVQKLKTKKAPIQETYSYPVWDQPWVFLLAIACFTIEWGLRRVKGLA